MHVSLSGHIFHHFYKNVFPACAGSTIPKIDTKHFEPKIHCFDVKSGPSRYVVPTVNSLRPPLTPSKMPLKPMAFQHFQFLAPKSPHIEASKSPSKAFKLHFSFSGHMFHEFYKNVLPAAAGSTIFKIDTKHFELTKITFFRRREGSDLSLIHI